MNVLQDKYDNIEQLAEILASGKTDGADIISLGEMWCCPYQTDLFPVYAEPEQQGDAWLAMSTLARKHNVYIVGGSIPESDSEGHTYNTCYVRAGIQGVRYSDRRRQLHDLRHRVVQNGSQYMF